MKLVNIHKQSVLLLILLLLSTQGIAQKWSLKQCIDSAQTTNKNLQIAKNNIAISTQKEREAKSNLLPRLSANADYKYFTNLPYQLMPLSTFNPAAPEGQFQETQFGVPHNINANLQLAIPIYNAQVYGGIEATKIASELTNLKLQKDEEQLYFEITNLYYNAQILHAQKAFLDSNLANASRLLSNLKLLQEQLLATGTDVGKVELQIAQLLNKKETINSSLTRVLNTLKFAIGISYETPFDVETMFSSVSLTTYPAQISLDSRLVLTQNKLTSNELKTLNNTRYLPSVNFIGSLGTTGFGYDKEPNTFLDFYPLGFAGVQISYPIFNGTVTVRKIDQKKIELRNNQLTAALIQDRTKMQITNNQLQRGSTFRALETTQQQIKLAQTIYNNTNLQQAQGIASLTEVLLADNALREAQQANVNAIIEYLKADLELKKLTGNISNWHE